MVDRFDLARSKLPGSCLSDQKEKKKKKKRKNDRDHWV